MSNSYVIEWKSLVNGRTGRGTKLFDFEEAHRLANELNLHYPDIHHEPVEVNNSATAPSTTPVPEPESAAEVSEQNHNPDHALSFV